MYEHTSFQYEFLLILVSKHCVLPSTNEMENEKYERKILAKHQLDIHAQIIRSSYVRRKKKNCFNFQSILVTELFYRGVPLRDLISPNITQILTSLFLLGDILVQLKHLRTKQLKYPKNHDSWVTLLETGH